VILKNDIHLFIFVLREYEYALYSQLFIPFGALHAGAPEPPRTTTRGTAVSLPHIPGDLWRSIRSRTVLSLDL
jgi:hypothetical protein